jgi:NADH-quinone oxidoreductase subunit L
MSDIDLLLVLVPGLPLLAAVLTAVFGKHVLGRQSHWPTVLAIGLSFVASLVLLVEVWRESHPSAEAARQTPAEGRPLGYERVVRLWTWASVSGQSPDVGWDKAAVATAGPPRTGGNGGPALAYASLSHPTNSRHYVYYEKNPTLRPLRRVRLVELTTAPPEPDFHVDIALRADPLTVFMLVTVTFVSLLVAVYSIGYMHGDPGYWRFFSYIALFVFSMTMLVAASNFVLLYVFWEGVGLCSYLLIGFWFQKPAAVAAGKKAFLVNRVGDFAFALGLFLIWSTYGTLDFHDTFAHGVRQTLGIFSPARLADPALYVGGGTATAICLLLFAGACGKSAQIPLHVWLPDAMEGPTPVSALIHAATMVTAGVYMVARCTPLFQASPDARHVVAALAGLTALLAALMAITQTDLKRILAYSTISQLGYMFLGLGTGTFLGITAGMFHLLTHACFKALLFLGAGSVMHAMGGVIDIRRLGGLRKLMPTTYWTFLFGCLALSGFPGFAGFFSKDRILAALHDKGTELVGGVALYQVLYLAAVFTAGLTAFYTFRALLLTFHGSERIPHEAGDHARESPRVMTWPLVVLAILSLAVGGWFEWTQQIPEFLAGTPSLAYLPVAREAAASSGHLEVALIGTAMAGAGIAAAWFLYLRASGLLRRLTALADVLALYRLAKGKFYFDALYLLFVVWPLEQMARLLAWMDRWIIDGLVDFCGALPRAFGSALRMLQGGMIQFYAMCMVLGLLIMMALLLLWGA